MSLSPLRSAAATLAFAACLPFAAADPADAQQRGVVGLFGGSGAGAGQFGAGPGPRGVAVDPSTGNVYVVDAGGSQHRIQRFDASGNFIAQIGAGPTGALGAQLNQPRGVATDSAGNVYVSDGTNLRIQRFAPDGGFNLAWGFDVLSPATVPAAFEVCAVAANCKVGVGGGNGGQFGSTFGGKVATGPSNDHLYVGDTANRRIQEFRVDDNATPADPADDTPVLVRAIGWGVATGADALETCTSTADPPAAGSCLVGRAGATGGFGNDSPRDVAVDTAGSIYALETSNAGGNRVVKIAADASTSSVFAPAQLSGNAPIALAVDTKGDADAGNDTVLVARRSAGGTTEVWIQEFDVGGDLIATIGQGVGIGAGAQQSDLVMNLSGLAVNPGSGRVYFAVASGLAAQRQVWIFDEVAPAAADLRDPDPVTAIGAHSATFHGVVNPNGAVGVSYHFEYGKEGGEWRQAGTTGTLVGGTAPIEVSRTVSTLEANQGYRARLVVRKDFGGPRTDSDPVQFTTPVAPPGQVETLPPSPIRPTAARLRGSFNANNLPTTYHFEYGTDTDYGTKLPLPDGDGGSLGMPVEVRAWVRGLEPGTVYHYRIVADSDEGPPVEAPDRTFRTPVGAPQPPAGRAYEMVTPADKSVRRGGDSLDPDEMNAALGYPSASGNSVMHVLTVGVLGEPGGALGHDNSRLVRGTHGWELQPVMNRPLAGDPANSLIGFAGANADQAIQAVGSPNQVVYFPEHVSWLAQNPRVRYTRFFDGLPAAWAQGPEFARHPGWVSWVSGPIQAAFSPIDIDYALFSDDGRYMLRGGRVTGLLGAGDPALAQDPAAGAVYRQDLRDGTLDLVSACTGAGPAATVVPERDDNGTPAAAGDDTLAPRDCPAGALPAGAAGAPAGGGSIDYAGRAQNDGGFNGPAANAVASDGRRAFFLSPDPIAANRPALTTLGCTTATGPASSCQPQLFVRQWDSDGNPTVRWISKPQRWDLDTPGDRPAVAALGRGAAYAGASTDGSRVFFVTNSPLLDSDPNGGASAEGATATASSNSWDLYQYTLPASKEVDPGAGTLTRITGGPSGSADPNTNPGAGALRYLSSDGTKAYFVTRAPIPGAVDASPAGSGPANTPGSGLTVRNLYLYDAEKSGAARWKFVARLPVPLTGGTGSTSNLDGCAGTFAVHGPPLYVSSADPTGPDPFQVAGTNCVFGEPGGRFVAFTTSAQLTGDDGDSAQDVYRYDAQTDELTRVSAPPAGATDGSYRCVSYLSAQCNADFGYRPTLSGAAELTRGASGLRHLNVTPDGAVFFESRRRLVADDRNGSRMDTYAYQGGALSLISPGSSDDDAFYSGSSVDGKSVFFDTTEPIDVHREIDPGDRDVYVARVGDGFPSPDPPAPPCTVLADACQGAGAAAPPRVTETEARGGDNATPAARVRLAVAGLSVRERRLAARSGVIALRVRTNRAGRIVAVARGRVRLRRGQARVRRLARQVARTPRAGRMTLRLRLAAPARRQLRAGRPLRVAIRVTQPGARARTVTTVIRRAGR